jgi:hypothetical protein
MLQSNNTLDVSTLMQQLIAVRDYAQGLEDEVIFSGYNWVWKNEKVVPILFALVDNFQAVTQANRPRGQ